MVAKSWRIPLSPPAEVSKETLKVKSFKSYDLKDFFIVFNRKYAVSTELIKLSQRQPKKLYNNFKTKTDEFLPHPFLF